MGDWKEEAFRVVKDETLVHEVTYSNLGLPSVKPTFFSRVDVKPTVSHRHCSWGNWLGRGWEAMTREPHLGIVLDVRSTPIGG